MSRCSLFESPDIELYFYGELDSAERNRVDAHLRQCPGCRERLADLHAIRRALASRPAVDAPAAGDWSGFMRRLDAAVGIPAAPQADVVEFPSRKRSRFSAYSAAAAMFLIAATGVFIAYRARPEVSQPAKVASTQQHVEQSPDLSAVAPQGAATDLSAVALQGAKADKALRDGSAEHLERSKLVVLGLAAMNPRATRAADWQYERRLAGTLLSDTRLYRMAAQDHGMNDVAHVMRDLETVLIETSMSDSSDREALARVQRLIAKRDLVVKMQLVSSGTN
jgi:anti-sigma factor RsiW